VKIKRYKIPLFILSFLLLACGIFILVQSIQQKKETRTRAGAGTVLSMEPASTNDNPIKSLINTSVPLDITLTPSANMVSYVRMEILYDATKLQPSDVNQFAINTTAFPITIEGPVYASGKIVISLSIGNDPTKAITQATKIGTVYFQTIATTSSPTSVSFGSTTEVLSVGPNDQARENVLGQTQPAYIQIGPLTTQIPLPSPTPSVSACLQKIPADIMLLFDNSGSMNEKAVSTDSQTKIQAAKLATKSLVDKFSNDQNVRIGLTTFSETQNNLSSPVNLALSNNFTELKSMIDSIKLASGSGTCIECGIIKANSEITTHGRTSAKKVYIIVTDGQANATTTKPYVSNNNPGQTVAETAAINAAIKAYNDQNISTYTIGLGTNVNDIFLQSVASKTGGKYFFTLTSNNLDNIYLTISNISVNGSVTGIVFNDANINKFFDTNEQKLSGWTIFLKDQKGTIIATAISDSYGAFTISGLCDGIYTVNEDVKSGFTQTVPVSPAFYTINVINGSASANKDFGNVNTPLPSSVIVNFNVFLHGIGSSGDNANPDSSMSNKNPLHPQRNVILEVTDENNKTVATKAGVIDYISTNGNFKGSVNLGPIRNGYYLIKIKTDRFLRKLYDGIQSLKSESVNIMSDITLVNGDANSDNVLNILDYNILYGCFSGDILKKPRSCTDAQKLTADLNDESHVNLYDLNLFLRELSVQNGK
jgi:Mg-chelatase subunit ChlD